MKQYHIKWTAALAGVILALGGVSGMTASATTVGDVIAHAYAVGLPDETIQQCINAYSSGTYTSEQCDAAIAELDAWAADRNNAISSVVAQGGGTTAVTQQGGNHATAAPNASGTTTTTAAFKDMPLDQKVDYINSMSQKDQETFMQNMTNEERNSFLKDLGVSNKADMLQGFLNIGESLGMNFSIDEISDDTIIVSTRDADGNLVDVMTFGNEIEATGKSYTVPILIAGGMIVLALGGMGTLLYYAKKQK